MNKFIFMGRLTRNPEVRYSSGENATCIANYDIAVDKRFKKKDDPDAPTADFFRITAMGKLGEFSEKYLHQGTKIVVDGRISSCPRLSSFIRFGPRNVECCTIDQGESLTNYLRSSFECNGF